MSRAFALIENGTVHNVILADAWPDGIDVTDTSPRPGPGWTYSGTTFAPPAYVPPVDTFPRYITRLAFDQRFTQTERITIDLAGDRPTRNATETDAQFQARQFQAGGLRDMRMQVNNATFIDLDRAETRGGVQQLEAMGLLAAGRALIILDTPVADAERYRG